MLKSHDQGVVSYYLKQSEFKIGKENYFGMLQVQFGMLV